MPGTRPLGWGPVIGFLAAVLVLAKLCEGVFLRLAADVGFDVVGSGRDGLGG